MKNITVSVDDETYRRARRKAADEDTSVSAVVRQFLERYAQQESEFDRPRRRELELLAQVPEIFSGSDRMARDELYDRGSRGK